MTTGATGITLGAPVVTLTSTGATAHPARKKVMTEFDVVILVLAAVVLALLLLGLISNCTQWHDEQQRVARRR
jgi:hypothetical protein